MKNILPQILRIENLHMLNDKMLNKHNQGMVSSYVKMRKLKLHENLQKNFFFEKFQANILSKMFTLTSGKIKYLVCSKNRQRVI